MLLSRLCWPPAGGAGPRQRARDCTSVSLPAVARSICNLLLLLLLLVVVVVLLLLICCCWLLARLFLQLEDNRTAGINALRCWAVSKQSLHASTTSVASWSVHPPSDTLFNIHSQPVLPDSTWGSHLRMKVPAPQ